MKMNEDCQGFLQSFLPICMRMNIFIVNIDTNANVRNLRDKWVTIQDFKSEYDDIKLWIDDSLNLHNETIYVLRKDGHYDIIYRPTDPSEYDRLS